MRCNPGSAIESGSIEKPALLKAETDRNNDCQLDSQNPISSRPLILQKMQKAPIMYTNKAIRTMLRAIFRNPISLSNPIASRIIKRSDRLDLWPIRANINVAIAIKLSPPINIEAKITICPNVLQ